MEVWEDLVKVAIVGTERQALAMDAGEDAVGRLLAQLEGEKEQKLLRACALLAPYRRAGYRAMRAMEALQPPVEQEELAAVGSEAALDLMTMLRGEYQEALSEWCQLVADQGLRVPDEHLVDLLEFGRTHSGFRDMLLPLLGKRGRWLAGQRQEWKYALQFSLFEIENAPEGIVGAVMDPDRVWATGTQEERVALLHHLRRSEPERARLLVESTWKQDPPEERAAFLETFKVGLSMEDEPLLETALDDKRKEVRRTAQEMLPTLPESRLCLRMWALAQPLIQKKQIVSGVTAIEVSLPSECSKAMIRDGIDPKSYTPALGEKAWWLQQIVGRVPLSCWCVEWSSSAKEIVGFRRPEEWKAQLRQGWSEALLRIADPQWATALFTTWIEEQSESMPGHFAWKAMLSLESFETGILQLLGKAGTRLTYTNPVWVLLDQYNTVWSRPFAQSFIACLRGLKRDTYQVVNRLATYAPYIPMEEMGAFLVVWQEQSEANTYQSRKIETYLALEDFRQAMRQRITAK